MAVVEDPLRQVGQLGADDVAENGKADKGRDRRCGCREQAEDDQRPAGGAPCLAGARRRAEPGDDLRKGGDAEGERDGEGEDVEAVEAVERQDVAVGDGDVAGFGRRFFHGVAEGQLRYRKAVFLHRQDRGRDHDRDERHDRLRAAGEGGGAKAAEERRDEDHGEHRGRCDSRRDVQRRDGDVRRHPHRRDQHRERRDAEDQDRDEPYQRVAVADGEIVGQRDAAGLTVIGRDDDRDEDEAGHQGGNRRKAEPEVGEECARQPDEGEEQDRRGCGHAVEPGGDEAVGEKEAGERERPRHQAHDEIGDQRDEEHEERGHRFGQAELREHGDDEHEQHVCGAQQGVELAAAPCLFEDAGHGQSS